MDHEQYQLNHFHRLERKTEEIRFHLKFISRELIQYIPTVEKRIKRRVFVPFLNTLALQISDKSSVASNTPKAPPLKKDDNNSKNVLII